MNQIALGDIAEKLAAKRIAGETSDADYMEMLKYYPENNPDEFINGWCAAFVYHCCREAGMNLPIGTNKTPRKDKFRWFTGVIAWVEWAKVCGFLYEANDFSPRRGDIVIYNNIIPKQYRQKNSLWCDHIGIVLACDEDTLTVAEGNVNNQNVSGVMNRPCSETIGCYIRIPEHNIYDDWQVDSYTLSFRKMRDTKEDKAQQLEWLSNPSVVEWAWKENAPWDLKKIEAQFKPKTLAGSSITPCFLELNGEAVGYIQFYPITEDSYRFEQPLSYEQFKGGYGLDLMIGYPGLWNKGIGSKAVRMMADYLIHTKGAKLICADPEENNPRSVACWKKAGFLPVGVIPDFDEPKKRSVLMVYDNTGDVFRMDKEKLIDFVTPYYANKDIMHNIWHIELVIKYVDRILNSGHYQVDYESLIYAAYFHGLVYSDEAIVVDWLRSQHVEEEKIQFIITIANESQRPEVPQTLEGKILHDAHVIEGGKQYSVVKCLITGSVRGQTLLQTIDYIEKYIIDNNKCYLPETIPLYEESNEYLRTFIQTLKEDIR